MRWRDFATGLLLVAAGGLLVAGNLGFMPALSFWQLWPLLLVHAGLSGLFKPYRAISQWFFDLVLIGLGGWFLASYLGYTDSSLGELIRQYWPVLLILLGVSVLAGPSRRKWIRVEFDPPSQPPEAPAAPGGRHYDYRMMGDLTYGADPWDLDNLKVDFGLGDVNVDLTTARLTPGRHVVSIDGYLGDVDVLMPRDLPVRISAHLGMGDLKVLGDRRDGFNLSLAWSQGPIEQEGIPWVDLYVAVKLGDITIKAR